ncbi:putative 3-beta-hydroxysteroid-Delta(8),Delta(7)-isomerase [Cavenderia fasciculata]|uniref:3-beta-hydroxysteroid-Delta(8),Delta(7)-isomerase n=1 Tax=Cavenderia fasciculata TaxID=261658 RepID=F4Q058_CACFS|nr:putative 3-beta-hydroxysteroid-Delta(8),Delta(7)-isomerase [Cavenderia fasciculata]EGG18738.1 putative 3-beta-hydroxysteroid-Delta(8),Delta(7)-isomerase [Cavenderia fasciculata]|eukprot:XP_004357200.1 putative 3-beta-hydroxysteroid-Delta(8),Delta(7)-isomerase [Cavenderia fasciculata]
MFTFLPLAVLTILCVVLSLFAKKEKLILFWLLWSGLIHIILEGSYGFFAHEVTKASEVDFMEKMFEDVPMEKAFDLHWYASLYSQYAKYDLRYAIADPMVVFFCFLELVQGAACFILALFVVQQSKYRHALQIFLSALQGLGTVFYFITPYIYGKWDELISSDPFELWVYVVGLNGLWLLIPIILTIQSFIAIGKTTAIAEKSSQKNKVASSPIVKQQQPNQKKTKSA